MSEAAQPSSRRPALGLAAAAAVVAAVLSIATGGDSEEGRDAALAAALAERGLVPDSGSVVWLDQPPFAVMQAATTSAVAVLRAAPGEQEPHDIYAVSARLSPEGVLLDVGRAYNLSETSAVDEQRPVGAGSFVAFAQRGMLGDEAPRTVRLLNFADAGAQLRAQWSLMERAQAAVTRLQQTGRLSGVQQVSYTLEEAAKELSLSVQDGKLVVSTGERDVAIDPAEPEAVPQWLTVEAAVERRPGNLVTWSVDRVRSVIGDESMQYIKAIAFSALDVVRSSQEAVTADTGEDDIAEDLGQAELKPVSIEVPVDPEIGFPPPPVKPWLKKALPGEGKWNAKTDNPFIHTLPGLPPTFVTTFIRSDRRRRATRVYIALWDPRMVQLNMMAGVAEPKSATGATGPGLVPREPTVLRRVAACMNAGFQALHGEYGMMSDGVIYLPPKPYGATVALKRDGSTAFGTWPNDPVIPSDILSYRQNMTVMVLDEKFNPYGRTWWGGTPADWEDRTHTVRTGICLTKENFVGYFYGADLSPAALSRAMIQTRCKYGIALDMNAGHSGLEFYKVAPKAEFAPLGRPLRRDWEREGDIKELDGWGFRARRLIRGMGLMNFPRYIRREGRDFFYLTLRYVLPGEPLQVEGAQGDDGKWQVKGLPQHGFPYALARTEVPVDGKRARVLRIDPRMITLDPAKAVDIEGAKKTVLLANTVDTDAKGPGLWLSPGAFAVSSEPPSEAALKLLGSSGADRGVAAVGAEDDSGMLVYLELIGETPAPAAKLREVLAKQGVSQALVLTTPWPLALGGDTSLAGEGVRLPAAAVQARFLRSTGPGGRTMFEDTPIVGLKEWHPLQARRIRYFKKRKKDS